MRMDSGARDLTCIADAVTVTGPRVGTMGHEKPMSATGGFTQTGALLLLPNESSTCRYFSQVKF